MEAKGMNLKIRGKLVFTFAVMILLTLFVSVIAFVSQKSAQSTINDIVGTQTKIARLSLQADKSVKVMTNYEKDFFLNYKQIGIQEAKKRYTDRIIEEGGNAYQTLYSIQQIAESQQSVETAQLADNAVEAMEAVNTFLSAVIGTVDIIELRTDPEFGELVKLDESIARIKQALDTVKHAPLREGFLELREKTGKYVALPNDNTEGEVRAALDEFSTLVLQAPVGGEIRENLQTAVSEYDQWFNQVAQTDKTISARVLAYQKAADKIEPAIQQFLERVAENEEAALVDLEEKAEIVGITLLVIGCIAVVFGGLVAAGLSRGITRQVNHIMDLLGEIGMGNFDARVQVVSKDELGTMAETLNAMLDNITLLIQSQEERDRIQESIMKLLEEISDLTDGDLTARAEVTEDITGAIADSFNTMALQFGDIIRQVKSTTSSVNDTADVVNARTMELADKSTIQAQLVNDAVKAIQGMVVSIHQVADNASASAEVSKTSRSNAKEGASAVNETNLAIEEIREQINETARSIKRLGESSLEIGNVVRIINDIADRTSILALNASIQAAMAGDAGHGFAVVAEEVQRLAESSSESTKQIEILVKSIQAEIKDVGNRMDESIDKVVHGTRLAGKAHGKLQEIESVADKLAKLIEAITQASVEQVKMSENVFSSMKKVGAVSNETSLASKQTAESMHSLSNTAHLLSNSVDVFKIESARQAA